MNEETKLYVCVNNCHFRWCTNVPPKNCPKCGVRLPNDI